MQRKALPSKCRLGGCWPYLLRTAKDIYYGFRKIKTVYFSFVSYLVQSNRIETFWRAFNVGRILKHFGASGLGESVFALCLQQAQSFNFFEANILLCKPFPQIDFGYWILCFGIIDPDKPFNEIPNKIRPRLGSQKLFLIVSSFFFKLRIHFLQNKNCNNEPQKCKIVANQTPINSVRLFHSSRMHNFTSVAVY